MFVVAGGYPFGAPSLGWDEIDLAVVGSINLILVADSTEGSQPLASTISGWDVPGLRCRCERLRAQRRAAITVLVR